MRLFRREGTGTHRFMAWRVGLFFLAAGLWMGGLIAGNRYATGIAIAVAFLAVILGLVAGRSRG